MNPYTEDYTDIMTYYDVGTFGANLWDFIGDYSKYPNGAFNTEMFNEYLDSACKQMKDAGINKIDLAFTSISDIDAYASGDFTTISPDDAIGLQLQQMQKDGVHFPEGEDLLSLLTQRAKQDGMSMGLSMGGENGTSMKIEGDPTDQAEKLVAVMKKYSIDTIDFDLEGAGLTAFADNGVDALRTFCGALFNSLTQENKHMTLTLAGATSNAEQLKALFFDDEGNKTFTEYFDGLNLMLYDNGTRYYIDAKQEEGTPKEDWYIEDWLNSYVGKENAGMLHIGFQDLTDYNKPSASGYNYETSGSSGEAAAEIFQKVQEILKADGFDTDLGEPFWWPSNSVGGQEGHQQRYAPVIDGDQTSADFVSTEMQDFYNKLNSFNPQVTG